MTLAELREMPTTMALGATRVHESACRSYNMLQYIRQKLSCQPATSAELLLELIDDVMDAPKKERQFDKQESPE